MSKDEKWWLISDETYRTIVKLLEKGEREDVRQALHQLDTGLHLTDAIPADCAGDRMEQFESEEVDTLIDALQYYDGMATTPEQHQKLSLLVAKIQKFQQNHEQQETQEIQNPPGCV